MTVEIHGMSGSYTMNPSTFAAIQSVTPRITFTEYLNNGVNLKVERPVTNKMDTLSDNFSKLNITTPKTSIAHQANGNAQSQLLGGFSTVTTAVTEATYDLQVSTTPTCTCREAFRKKPAEIRKLKGLGESRHATNNEHLPFASKFPLAVQAYEAHADPECDTLKYLEKQNPLDFGANPAVVPVNGDGMYIITKADDAGQSNDFVIEDLLTGDDLSMANPPFRGRSSQGFRDVGNRLASPPPSTLKKGAGLGNSRWANHN
jgi:hypothetical protein